MALSPDVMSPTVNAEDRALETFAIIAHCWRAGLERASAGCLHFLRSSCLQLLRARTRCEPMIHPIGGGNETPDCTCRRDLADVLSGRCQRAGELRSDTLRTGPHRLLPWPKSVLSWTIWSCRRQSARTSRCRVVSGNYRKRPSETQATSATMILRRHQLDWLPWKWCS